MLTGSSARKLRRTHVNLLGGRARLRYLNPFSCRELGDQFDLDRALVHGLPAVLPKDQAEFTFDQIISAIEKQPVERFQGEILNGLIHSEDVVRAALDKKIGLKSALGKVPKDKQEWLQFIGVYPYRADSPSVVALEYLVSDPKEFRKTVVEIMKLFWTSGFRTTWEHRSHRRALSIRFSSTLATTPHV